MEINNTCENYARCPVFNGVLLWMEMTAKHYKTKYCEAGPEGWEQCKRYQVKKKTGVCPPDLLPNAIKSVEEIIAGLKL